VLGEPVNGSAVEGDLHLPVGTRDHAQRSCGHGAGGLTLDGQRLPELEARARALNHPPGLLVGGVQRLPAGVDEHAAAGDALRRHRRRGVPRRARPHRGTAATATAPASCERDRGGGERRRHEQSSHVMTSPWSSGFDRGPTERRPDGNVAGCEGHAQQCDGRDLARLRGMDGGRVVARLHEPEQRPPLGDETEDVRDRRQDDAADRQPCDHEGAPTVRQPLEGDEQGDAEARSCVHRCGYCRKPLRDHRRDRCLGGDPQGRAVRIAYVWNLTDEAVLAGFGVGDLDAANELIRRFGRRVYGVAMTITRHARLADALPQEAFVRAWRHAETFDPRRGSGASWLSVITRNLAIDAMRAQPRSELVDPDDLDWLSPPAQEPNPADVAVRASDSEWLRSALDDVPDEQRRAVVLAGVLGFTAE